MPSMWRNVAHQTTGQWQDWTVKVADHLPQAQQHVLHDILSLIAIAHELSGLGYQQGAHGLHVAVVFFCRHRVFFSDYNTLRPSFCDNAKR